MRSAYLKMTLATILFGSYLVASKVIPKEVLVFAATLVRLVSATLVLGLYLGLRRSGGWQRPGRRDTLLLVTQSALGVFLFSIFAMLVVVGVFIVATASQARTPRRLTPSLPGTRPQATLQHAAARSRPFHLPQRNFP